MQALAVVPTTRAAVCRALLTLTSSPARLEDFMSRYYALMRTAYNLRDNELMQEVMAEAFGEWGVQF